MADVLWGKASKNKNLLKIPICLLEMASNFKSKKNYLKYMNLGFQMLILLSISGYIGNVFDSYFKFEFPFLVFFFPFVAFITYLYRIYYILIK